jgi:hypothetical protein
MELQCLRSEASDLMSRRFGVRGRERVCVVQSLLPSEPLQQTCIVNEMRNGIAHISYRGGGLFVPARTPYDRQLLVEQVVERVRTKGQVQVLVDDQRWMVYSSGGAAPLCCAGCGLSHTSACYSAVLDEAAFCVKCAFGTGSAEPAPGSRRQRLAG